MKIAGHTMGTPELDIFESINLFSRLGFDGIEIRSSPEGQLDLSEGGLKFNRATEDFCARIKKAASDACLEIVCLSAYAGDFRKESVAEAHRREIRHSVDVAASLGCPMVRVMGGACSSFWDGAKSRSESARITAKNLNELATYAGTKEVELVVETHAGTLAESAVLARKLMDLTASPHIGVIYDQDQIDRCEGEGPTESVELLAPYIRHVHLCPFKFNTRGCPERTSEILVALKKINYEGYLSAEYPRHGNSELPPAHEAMKHDLDFLRELLSK